MKRVLLHIAFWLVYSFQHALLIFLLNTTRVQLPTTENLLLSLGNCTVLLLPKLLFTYFILNVTLNKIIAGGFQKKEAFYSLIALVLTLLLYRALVVYFINPVIYGWDDPASTAFFYPLAFPVALMDVGFVSGVAIGLKQIRQQLRRTKAEQALIKEKLETELKFLRNQTNPHFLFNTLNNIYALARKKSDDTADVVMKLSKLLRFMLYDAAKPLITIGDEIKMLEDYIDLEKIRYNGRLSVSFLKEINGEQELISPLLLLPFVENAFKHGAGESRFASFIRIEMKLQNGVLRFCVENTKENNGQGSVEANIGLNNVKRQLELLYTDYDMQVSNEATVFNVLLTINLKSYAKINSLIIEDEPLAAEVLEDYVSQIPFLHLAGVCSDAIYALEVMQKEKIDLIFLDIHLPKLKGLDFIKTLDNPPKIIITSAYQDYALQGYELNVLDYLLKPLEFNRFVAAVNKARQVKENFPSPQHSQPAKERPFLFFNVGKKRVKIYLDEILFIESLKEYIKIVAKDKAILTKFQLGQTEELLKNENFLRIHRSFIVAKDKVDAFTATDVEIQGKLIPIGRSYKEQVYAQLEN